MDIQCPGQPSTDYQAVQYSWCVSTRRTLSPESSGRRRSGVKWSRVAGGHNMEHLSRASLSPSIRKVSANCNGYRVKLQIMQFKSQCFYPQQLPFRAAVAAAAAPEMSESVVIPQSADAGNGSKEPLPSRTFPAEYWTKSSISGTCGPESMGGQEGELFVNLRSFIIPHLDLLLHRHHLQRRFYFTRRPPWIPGERIYRAK